MRKTKFTFYSLILIVTINETSEAYICKECGQVGAQVLDYFHPVYRETEAVGPCIDVCEINPKFTDPVEIQAARNVIYQCSRIKISCKNGVAESKYPTLDGSCNNLKNPSWGMVNMCHRILLPHDYSDGASAPRKSCRGSDLPPARVISNALHRETRVYKGRQTSHFMEWAQLVAHDIARTDSHLYPDENPKSCCNPYPKQNDVCMGEAVPLDDPTYIGRTSCIPFERVLVCSQCNGSSLEALNKFTSYFDLSLLYGDNMNLSMQLRRGVDGMLKTQYIPGVGELPPPTPGMSDEDDFCRSLNSTHKCFLAGDTRIAQNALITTTHIILLRNHNNICDKLKVINPHWNDKKLFFEARRINTAQAQFITYAHYLPIVLGRLLMSKFNLTVLDEDKCSTYDPEMDATILAEFTSAANRYGHSLVPNSVKTMDPDRQRNATLYIQDCYFRPFDYYTGLLDRLALGMANDRVRKQDSFYASSIRDFLFYNIREHFIGLDLAAMSVIRGRDQGFPGYSSYLKYLFNHDVRSFCDLRRFVPPMHIRKMKKIYKSVHDIDLYTGGLAEYKIRGSLLGPTLASLIIIQHKKMKFGDRYYFEHCNQAGSFKKDQLLQIKKTTLARMICETINSISKIQADVFHPPSERRNPVKSCKLHPELDLSPWAENVRQA